MQHIKLLLMNKIFTMLGAALMMGSLAANAETKNVYVRYYDADNVKVSQKSYSTDLSLNEDGSFTLADFLHSGKPFSFSFEIPDVNTYGYNITLTGEYINKETYDDVDYFYLMDCKKDEYTYYTYEGEEYINDDCYAACYSYAKDSDEATYIFYPYLIGGYNQVYHYDITNEANKNEYYLSFYIYGSDSTGDYIPGYYQVYFYINMSEFDTTNPGGDENAEEVTLNIEDDKGYQIGDACTSGIVFNEDGSITLTDFVNSGQPFSFKYEFPYGDEYGTIEVTSPTYVSKNYVYLRDKNDKNYLDCTVYNYNGTEGATKLETPLIYVDESFVLRNDMTDPENKYEYYASLSLLAWIGDKSTSFCVSLFFNLPENSGVQTIENADAPVEFYNLNGMKVENPSNGIFIRKQGNKTSKVIVK